MEMLLLFLRTIFVYIIVFLTLRIMGKREIGKLSVFDLVISIMIAEIAVFIIDDLNKTVMHGLLPIATLVLIQLATAKMSLHSQKARAIIDGKPSFLIKHGKLDRDEMKRQRYNLDDLMTQLRQNQVINVADVEFAILETSGKLTVVEKPEEKPEAKPQAEQQDGQSSDCSDYKGLPIPLIMDGQVQEEGLLHLGKTRSWLKEHIQQQGANDFEDVFFCSIDRRGVLFVDLKT